MFNLAYMRAKRMLIFSCLALALTAGGLYHFLTGLCLFVETDQGMVLAIPSEKGEKFSLKYIHSVQKTPVTENFIIISAGQLLLDSTVYQSYGVGLPALPSEGRFARQGDTFVLTGLERRFEKVVLRTGPEARHAIEMHNQLYPLYTFDEGGAVVTIRVGPYYSRWLRYK